MNSQNLLKNPQTNWKYVIIIVVLAVIVGGGILGYYYLWLTELETKLAEIEVRLPEKAVPEVPVDETANWESYRNEEYGFEMKYPNDWIIGVGEAISDVIHWRTSDQPTGTPWVMDLMILERDGKTVGEWIQQRGECYTIIKTIIVEEIEGIMVSDGCTMGNAYDVVFFPVKNYMYSIGIASSPPEISTNPVDLLTKILSTFRFSPH